ncbi:hypothetical protein ACOMHN_013447 [Nucella lapillus]
MLETVTQSHLLQSGFSPWTGRETTRQQEMTARGDGNNRRHSATNGQHVKTTQAAAETRDNTSSSRDKRQHEQQQRQSMVATQTTFSSDEDNLTQAAPVVQTCTVAMVTTLCWTEAVSTAMETTSAVMKTT